MATITQKPTQHISEEQIRPAELMQRKRKHLEADRNFLINRRDRFVHANCPACDQDSFVPYGTKDTFEYVRCQSCATVYTNPRPSLDLLHEFYSTSENYEFWNKYIFPSTEDVRRERIFKPRAEKLAEICKRFDVAGGTFLEIGAAFGTFCEQVQNQEIFDKVIAVEPTTGLAQTCRERGLETREQFVEDLVEIDFAKAIAAFEVIEHLFAPTQFIQACHRILEPNGLLILSCPNSKGFDVATLGTVSGTYDHEHLNYFHPESLSLLLNRNNFNVLDVSTPGKLDAELVRKAILAEKIDLSDQPFLQEVLVERWEELGENFQQFIADHRMSSHMWIVARKK